MQVFVPTFIVGTQILVFSSFSNTYIPRYIHQIIDYSILYKHPRNGQSFLSIPFLYMTYSWWSLLPFIFKMSGQAAVVSTLNSWPFQWLWIHNYSPPFLSQDPLFEGGKPSDQSVVDKVMPSSIHTNNTNTSSSIFTQTWTSSSTFTQTVGFRFYDCFHPESGPTPIMTNLQWTRCFSNDLDEIVISRNFLDM